MIAHTKEGKLSRLAIAKRDRFIQLQLVKHVFMFFSLFNNTDLRT
jgi:hypothetical protein